MTTALAVLRHRIPNAAPRIAIILGSGWTDVVRHVQNPTHISYSDLPGFPVTNVQGHDNSLIHGTINGQEVVVLAGRMHPYEHGSPDDMKLPILTLRDWGCDVLVPTNAAGSLNAHMTPGSLMVLTDYINLWQESPLIGEGGINRFVNMDNAYDADLRRQAIGIASTRGETLHNGVYMWFLGPQFETPAEIRMAKLLGADATGMSTVPETIIARYAGMRVLAFSHLVCMSAGLSGEVLSHAYTLSQASANKEKMVSLFCDVIGQLQLGPCDEKASSSSPVATLAL
jgi:purine-nucleoside phosphorylase